MSATSGQQDEVVVLSPRELILRRFLRHRLAVLSLGMLVVLYGLAVFADFFAPYSKLEKDLDYSYAPPQSLRWSWNDGFYTPAIIKVVHPIDLSRSYLVDRETRVPLSFFVQGSESVRWWGLFESNFRFFGVDYTAYAERYPDHEAKPTFFLLGADKYGQDLLSRLLFGARISLSIGLVAVLVTFLLGVSLGGISGYVGGRVDTVIQRLIEILNSFPHIPLWLAIGAVLPPDWSPLKIYFAITIALSLLSWTSLARVVRGKILSLREEDYAVAARLLGASHGRVLFRHLVPGFTSHIIVALTLSIPVMILGETALSFLGLGLRPPVVSWGVMLQDCLQLDVVLNYPWLLSPALFIVLAVLSFSFVGDGVRDAADPYD